MCFRQAIHLLTITKFLNMGGVDLHDNTAKNEQKLQNRLLDLVHQNIFVCDVYDRVGPTGSKRPRIYGLPKTHKENIPLRPILSMIGSSQQEPAKWLAEILVPVLKLYFSSCIFSTTSCFSAHSERERSYSSRSLTN